MRKQLVHTQQQPNNMIGMLLLYGYKTAAMDRQSMDRKQLPQEREKIDDRPAEIPLTTPEGTDKRANIKSESKEQK